MIASKLTWVGYLVDFVARTASLSSEKRQKISSQFSQQAALSRPLFAEIESLVGRMSWASVIFPIARVYLHRFYTLLTALRRKTHVRRTTVVPQGVAFLRESFSSWLRLIDLACEFPPPTAPTDVAPQERLLVRTDACAAGEFAYIGGWCGTLAERKANQVKWFLFRVPFQFFEHELSGKSDKASALQRIISALEVLGVAVGVALFGSVLSCGTHAFSIAHLESDSMVAVGAAVRWYSPSAAMCTALIRLAEASVFHQIRPAVSHCPGRLNVLADAISRAPVEAAKADFVRGRLDPCRRVNRFPPAVAPFFGMLEPADILPSGAI